MKLGVLMGGALVIAGLLPVLYFAALLTWQFNVLFEAGSWVPLPATLVFSDHSLLQAGRAAPVLPFIPHFAWPWLMSPESFLPVHPLVTSLLGRLHVGLVFAIAGAVVMAIGVFRARQYMSVFRAVNPAVFDERREPYIGVDNGVVSPDGDAAHVFAVAGKPRA
jgi:hypothetical protein